MTWSRVESRPKYSLFERERRWLVEPALLPTLGEARRIEDRYLDGTGLRLRAIDGKVWKFAPLAAIVPPAWCGVEVTEDPRYAGGVLARTGHRRCRNRHDWRVLTITVPA